MAFSIVKFCKWGKSQSFIQNVTMLASGMAIAQLLPILVSPVLTRLYSPEQFGLFAIFMAFISSFRQASTGHYEIAMVTPKNTKTAGELFVIALYFGLAFAAFLLVIIYLFHSNILIFLKAKELDSWLYISPLMLLALGMSNLGAHYANRKNNYSYMAHAALLQGVIIVILSLLLGIMQVGFSGLIIAYFIGSIFSFFYLWWRHQEMLTEVDFSISSHKISIAKDYKDYPLFSGSMSIFDGLSLALPTFFLASGYPEAIVGYYALVMRILYSPLTFLSTSVGQVNLKKMVDLIHNNCSVLPYLHKITVGLIVIASFPALILFLFGPELFVFFFSDQWRIAGEFAQILAPALVIRFTASTLSSTLGATQHLKLAGLWKFTAFLFTWAVLWYFSGEVSAQTMLQYLVLTDILLYLFYYTLIYYSAAHPLTNE